MEYIERKRYPKKVIIYQGFVCTGELGETMTPEIKLKGERLDVSKAHKRTGSLKKC